MVREILFGALLFSTSLHADESIQWEAGLKSRIENFIKKSGINKSDLGIYITYENVSEDREVISVNGSKKMVPASLTKVVTAAAALSRLNEGHQFETKLVANTFEMEKEGVMPESLYLIGGGNPSFVAEDMWVLVNDFVRSKITKIEGDIIVDDSLFDEERFDESRTKKRVDRAYDAPVGAMSFNWNSVNVYVRPAQFVGRAAQVFVDPENEYIELVNKTKTGKVGSGYKLAVAREATKTGDKIIVTGTIGINAEEKVYYKSISKPGLWSGYNLKAFLKRRGIELKGQVKRGKAPQTAEYVLARRQSKPLMDIVKDMLKFSNNYVAEMLVKNLSRKRTEAQPGNMKMGLDELNDYLASDLGIKKEDYELVNPSGLTRENKFTGEGLGHILNKLKDQFQVFPEFLVGLPIAGVDGTLKSRMQGLKVKSWVRAKTGRLDGVIGLAGFAKSRKKPLFTFVFIYNGKNNKMNKAIGLADQIANALVNES